MKGKSQKSRSKDNETRMGGKSGERITVKNRRVHITGKTHNSGRSEERGEARRMRRIFAPGTGGGGSCKAGERGKRISEPEQTKSPYRR